MVSPILFAGGEDFNFVGEGGTIASVATNGLFAVDTTAGRFRSGYARYALTFQQGANGTSAYYLKNTPSFASSSFWFSARLYCQSQGQNSTTPFIRFMDSSNVIRLRVRMNTSIWPSTIVIDKLDAAGSATTLATSTAIFGSQSPAIADKIDVFVNYAVSGTFTVYCNGVQIVTYSGDVTTNSVTSLSSFDITTPNLFASGGVNQGVAASWSEMIVSTRDTRNMSLVTQAPTAIGNSNAWTGGTVANISANFYGTTSDINPFSTSNVNVLQEFTVAPSLPAGNFSVLSVVQTARITLGSSGPGNIQLVVRTGGADFTSSNITVPSAWTTVTNAWDTNPNTSAPWAASELAGSSTSFNMGLKSIT